MSERWWYCIPHARVEGDDGCKNAERLGPYDTPAQAERALQGAAERTHDWDEDPRWKDD